MLKKYLKFIYLCLWELASFQTSPRPYGLFLLIKILQIAYKVQVKMLI